jgi:hypothetical protein
MDCSAISSKSKEMAERLKSLVLNHQALIFINLLPANDCYPAMKKYLLLCSVLIIGALALVSYHVPPNLKISEVITVNCITDAVFRKLSDETNWNKWSGNQLSASITKKNTNAFEISMFDQGMELKSYVQLLSIPTNNTVVKWETSMETGRDPFTQLFRYYKALAIKKNMRLTMSNLSDYLSRFENVYGFRFQEGSITDTLLVTKKSVSTVYPGTNFIYSEIEKLQRSCKKYSALITGKPMINISNLNATNYQLMVAIPVNKMFTSGDSVVPKRMIPGKFIFAEVKGGPEKIRNILNQLNLYSQDFGRTSVAIPFEYLVTDRIQVPDSSKWLTKIYLPVY